MKHLFILAISLFSIGAHAANPKAIEESRRLVMALNQASHEALILADQKFKFGQMHDVTNLDQVSNEALQMARAIHRRVYRQLLAGGDELKIKQELKSHHDTFEHMDDHLAHIGHEAEKIVTALEEADEHFHHLEEQLAQGGPVTVACVGKSGGNFFKPKTHVECTVFGAGLVGWEVVLSKNGQTATRAGQLKPFQGNQQFVTDKVELGWNPQYQVYLINTKGKKDLVAQGTAEGSPF